MWLTNFHLFFDITIPLNVFVRKVRLATRSVGIGVEMIKRSLIHTQLKLSPLLKDSGNFQRSRRLRLLELNRASLRLASVCFMISCLNWRNSSSAPWTALECASSRYKPSNEGLFAKRRWIQDPRFAWAKKRKDLPFKYTWWFVELSIYRTLAMERTGSQRSEKVQYRTQSIKSPVHYYSTTLLYPRGESVGSPLISCVGESW